MSVAPTNARNRYQKDGFYLQTEPLFPASLIEKAIAGMDAIRQGNYDTGLPPSPSRWNPGDDENALCKIEQPQFASHAIRELLNYPALGELAAALTGASMVQVWWVQLLYKPPTPPNQSLQTNVGWHQDRYYWNVWEEGSELFTAWIALSEVTEESGAMHFVRGSHRWGFQKGSDFFAQNLSDQKTQLTPPKGETWEEVSGALPLGGVSFHDNLTFHGSGQNTSGAPRRSFAVHLRTQNSRPVDNNRQGLCEFLDNPVLCPIIYR